MEKKVQFIRPKKADIDAAFNTPSSVHLANGAEAAFSKLYTYPGYRPIPTPASNDWLANHDEKGQLFSLFTKSTFTQVPTPQKNVIYICPLENSITEGFLQLLVDFCKLFYPGMDAKVLRTLNLDYAAKGHGPKIESRINDYTEKLQYNATQILDKLSLNVPKDAYCLMGCLNSDIYPRPEWNFVFGLANNASKTGVFSFARFAESFFDDSKKDDYDSLELKSLKVMVHEIGHTFNLRHCIYFLCTMNGSNHMEESSNRPLDFCPVCLKKIQFLLKFNVLDRFQKLQQFCAESKNKELQKLGQYYGNTIDYLHK